ARPADLSASDTIHDFGEIEVGVPSAPFTWTITNAGDVPTGLPTLTNTNPDDFVITNHCTAPLAATASCTVVVSYRATNGGFRSGTITLSASPGGNTFLNVSATGMVRLTVNVTGTGTVTSDIPGINCPATCTALFPFDENVSLQARTANGSGFFFSGGW